MKKLTNMHFDIFCNISIIFFLKYNSDLKFWTTFFINQKNDVFEINDSMLFWYFWIFRKATATRSKFMIFQINWLVQRLVHIFLFKSTFFFSTFLFIFFNVLMFSILLNAWEFLTQIVNFFFRTDVDFFFVFTIFLII